MMASLAAWPSPNSKGWKRAGQKRPGLYPAVKKNNELAGAHEFDLHDEPELLQKNVKL